MVLKYADGKYIVEELKSYTIKGDNPIDKYTIAEIVTTKNKYYPRFDFTTWTSHGEVIREYGNNNLVEFCKQNKINTRMYMADYIYDKWYDKESKGENHG